MNNVHLESGFAGLVDIITTSWKWHAQLAKIKNDIGAPKNEKYLLVCY